MKYPIGIQSFDQLIEDGYVYVDKTDLVYSLVKEGKIYFLSRPRRFGKSLLVSTLKNYFLGRKELFKGLKIDALEKDWKVYPVFHLDFNGTDFTLPGELERKLGYYISSWADQYAFPEKSRNLGLGDFFAEVIRAAHEHTGRRAVVLIDEYDKPILDVLDTDASLEERNRNTLKAFYSAFKSADEHLQFVFLTGVTKFSQVSVFSGFNQPFDISMHGKYETLCGISQEELDATFRESMEAMSEVYRCSYDEMRAMLKAQYDGYHFSKKLSDVYNPFSLLNAFASMDISDYWFKSGTPTYLIRLLSHTDENMNEITGKYYSAEEFIDYKANVEQPLPMIYQSGYLTIKDFDLEENTFLLDYPNKEVKRGFLTMVASSYFSNGDTPSWIRNAVTCLKKGELDDFRTSLTSFLASIPYTMRRKENERERERYFHYTFYLLMRLISVYTVYTEKVQSHGRVDCIVETPDFVYIFEFKLDGTAEEALRQIKEKGYAREYEADQRKLYKIGAVFSSETGTIADWRTE
ncbi:ATP-binding protein [Phocaeicola fibrisolvens]|uniref:ATP-binding protein n=1 Tax=Phocaeicola fibrisolvens TaxID=2981793 RepID=UPI000821E222|nr:ATP-binding protein [Phocaeicola fibrisolvens]MBU3835831.1 ATP-binding protein [Candidatus Phocaeicola merdigallinarum]MCU6778280.1 ATP-binding protein [Phocaeicola fibrisolvens]SCH81787.1 Predicted AAA-ATPase [uncultured Bacteroides sp.]